MKNCWITVIAIILCSISFILNLHDYFKSNNILDGIFAGILLAFIITNSILFSSRMKEGE